MWRDPYERGGLGQRLLLGLGGLLLFCVGVRVLAAILAPLVPLLIMAVVVVAMLLWFWRQFRL